MKLLAALTLLLPAVHAAAVTPHFYLRAGEDVNDPVVVKSPENPFHYIVVFSGSGVAPEEFHLGAGGTIIDLDGYAVLVDENDDEYLHISLTDKATGGFSFDEEGELEKTPNDGEEWYLCIIVGDENKKLLRYSVYNAPMCEETEVYRIPLN